jgi:stearoyl-CoA desaturase (delta-9 desaturase)
MAPNLFGNTATLYLEASQQGIPQEKSETVSKPYSATKKSHSKYTWSIVWRNVIAFVYLHLGALYGFYLFFTATKFLTVVWCKYYLLPF